MGQMALDVTLRDEIFGLFMEEQGLLAELDQLEATNEPFIAQLEVHGLVGPFVRRAELVSLAGDPEAPELVVSYVELSRRVADRVSEILHDQGWPGYSVVGADGAMAFAALVAHADDYPELRRDAIEAMRIAVEAEDADSRHFAHIVDRTRAVSGQPQVYGTVLVPENGTARIVVPIETEDQVDSRRAAIGLPPLRDDIRDYEAGATMGAFMVPTVPTSNDA
jgi:hypothetical protein